MLFRSYCDSARKAQHYYYSGSNGNVVKNEPFGDARASIITHGMGADSSCVYTLKPQTAYILLYRNTTVWLHLAEALNRMGYPDLAFAVLKSGLYNNSATENVYERYGWKEVYEQDEDGNDILDEDGNKVLNSILSRTDINKHYIRPESYELLTTTLPFLSQENSLIFRDNAVVGIHFHGAGAVKDEISTYQYKTVLNAKIADISEKFNLGLQPDDDGNYTKEDYINAMEDLLCDEYAMEFAFEGTRFSDLRRLAIHKNSAGIYGGNFGDTWLSHMLQNNAPGITTQNCYLPYK